MYRASNWTRVGCTRGFARRNGKYTNRHGKIICIFVRPLRRGARKRLRAIDDHASWATQIRPVYPSNLRLPLLLDELEQIRDPRHSRGRRHRLSMLLAIWALAQLSGFKCVDAAWKFSQRLSQAELRALGSTWDHSARRFRAPSRATIHRAVSHVDQQVLEQALLRCRASARKDPNKQLVPLNAPVPYANSSDCWA